MLQKIYSISKQNEIINNIKQISENQDSELRHKKRLYTIGFLNYCGYADFEIKNILEFYNPKLINGRYCNIAFIRDDVLAYCNKEKSIIKEEPSHIIAKRSEANIPFNLSEITKFRYDLIPTDDKNKQFFFGADIIAYGYKDKVSGIEKYNLYNNKYYKYNPKTIPVYRSIGGSTSVLFVCDLDKNNFNNDFNELLKYAKFLKTKLKWDIIKFSGSEGIHLIKFLRKETTTSDLKALAHSLDPFHKFLDWHLFSSLDWKIRGYCINNKTSLMSDDIDLDTFSFDAVFRSNN